jgi:hypothetical protein
MVKGILKAQIQQLLSFDEIPLHFKSQDRLMNASKKLWMLEETVLPIIDIINIIDHCVIWLEDNILPSYFNFQLLKLYTNLIIDGKSVVLIFVINIQLNIYNFKNHLLEFLFLSFS